MALYFSKQRRWPPKQPMQFVFAFGALLLAITVMVAWMLISYRQANPPSPDVNSEDGSHYTEPLTSVDQCLLILDFSDSKRFILIQTDPAHDRINAAAIPGNIADDRGVTLTDLLNKHGSLRVIQTVSSALEMSVKHYITLTDTGAQTFLSELDSGITYTLPEELQYTDENGATIRLSAGEQKLTGAQAAAVLKYTKWSDATMTDTVSVGMIASVLNQYLLPERRLDGYFAALANAAQTDLRIDNFNAFRHTLLYLSDRNNGTICHAVALIGKTEHDLFIPNVDAMRNETSLYP